MLVMVVMKRRLVRVANRDGNKKEDYCVYNNHLCPLFHLLHHNAFHPGIGHQLGPFSRLRVEDE